MTHGPQRETFNLSFEVPSVCADRLENGSADIGLVPCAELDRLQLNFFPDLGIACRGPVRSILLISRVAPSRIRSLAADTSSRTSVMLARILLSERYGASPVLLPMAPDLDTMLSRADAALIIGDPALHIDPSSLPFACLDLGGEWLEHTGLPMVFAVWAGKSRFLTPQASEAFRGSLEFGMKNFDALVSSAAASHAVSPELARTYLTRHIVFRLGAEELKGLEHYRHKVRQLCAPDLDAVPL